MRKQHSQHTRWLALSLMAMAVSGCSSMAQQAAPVESASSAPAAPIVTAAPAPAQPATTSPAVATPYKSGGDVVAKPVSVANGEKTHIVQPGENLFRISLNNGLKYKDVAAWNNLPDFNIKVGQVLRLTPPDGGGTAPTVATAPVISASAPPAGATATQAQDAGNSKNYPKALKVPYSEDAVKTLPAQSEGGKKAPAKAAASSAPAATAATTHKDTSAPQASAPAATIQPETKKDSKPSADGEDTVAWIWPTEGKMIRGYSDSNKGIDISGRSGQPVVASGDGKVVYSGNGLRGYGKLIIIKHNKTFLSAYAHNSQLLVKEGQSVKKGQKIAEMGNTDADQVKLHFEVRRFGKPVDPMQYLDNKP